MGCAQGKPSMNSPPKGLDKLKMDSGYVGRSDFVGPRRSTGQKYPQRETSRKYRPETMMYGNFEFDGGNGKVEGDEKLLVGKEEEKDGENVAKRLSIGEEELVGGWPKWLTDNIPRHVLAGLVPKSAESYDKLAKVGQGTYSNVYKARDRDTGKIVALKKVKFDTSESESVKFMAREIMILQKLDHPHIVKLEGLATSRMQYSLYLVFEFMQSDLASIISRPEGLTEPQVKCYMYQLLSDFGLANYYTQKRPLTNRVVTLWYRAPELLLGATNYGVGIDLWSAGCLLAEMFLGRPIMPGRTEVEQLHSIFKLCGTPSEDYWKKLKLSITFRPPKSYKPCFQEAFMDLPASSLGLLSILLALDPLYRGNASSALQNKFFFTSPLACDVSDLPVVYNEDDELNEANELRNYSNSKMKRRSCSHRGRRRKNLSVKKPEDSVTSKKELEKAAEPSTRSEEPGSTTSSTSSSVNQTGQKESPYFSLSPFRPSDLKICERSRGYPNANWNDKNLPPLPKSKSRMTTYNKDNNMYKANLINRSASTREFRNAAKMEHLELYTVEN
ncbi:hypothetical protein FNV43_RR10651 [Rhamnella rubrinervis]|uniref:Protein kinase domain-containing protein n=1 Tax=Rhamnella rubrinervis TaxID=2594499 RepID=A0A8K0MH35_9ROSA|nr:hypothetical protein FNV43_RR10651 [Rhamnella rubrinervis]